MTLPIVISNTANLLGIMAIGFSAGIIFLPIGIIIGRAIKPLPLSIQKVIREVDQYKKSLSVVSDELARERSKNADYEACGISNEIMKGQIVAMLGRIK